MLTALLAIIPITILFFWFKSLGRDEIESNKTEVDLTEDFYTNER